MSIFVNKDIDAILLSYLDLVDDYEIIFNNPAFKLWKELYLYDPDNYNYILRHG